MSETACRIVTKIYREKISGPKSDRQELRKLLRAIQHGDVLMVSQLDGLARSTRDLLNILDAVANAGRRLPIIEGCLGRYDDAAWAADADHSRRPCRI